MVSGGGSEGCVRSIVPGGLIGFDVIVLSDSVCVCTDERKVPHWICLAIGFRSYSNS